MHIREREMDNLIHNQTQIDWVVGYIYIYILDPILMTYIQTIYTRLNHDDILD